MTRLRLERASWRDARWKPSEWRRARTEERLWCDRAIWLPRGSSAALRVSQERREKAKESARRNAGSVSSWSSVMSSVRATSSGSASKCSRSNTYSRLSRSTSSPGTLLELRRVNEPGELARAAAAAGEAREVESSGEPARFARCWTESSRSWAPSSFMQIRQSGGIWRSGERRWVRSSSRLWEPRQLVYGSEARDVRGDVLEVCSVDGEGCAIACADDEHEGRSLVAERAAQRREQVRKVPGSWCRLAQLGREEGRPKVREREREECTRPRACEIGRASCRERVS